MKVLIIQGGIDSNLVTGEKVVIDNDIKFLQENGTEVFYKEIKIPNSGWQSVGGKIGGLIWSFSNYKKVKSIVDKYEPDIVHFHTIVPYLSFSVIYAAFKARVPIVQTLHNGRWLCVEGAYFRNNTFCNDCAGDFGWLGVKNGCGHGKLVSLLLFLNNFFVRRFGFLFKHVSHFIAVSNFVREQHIQSGFPKGRTTVRNNGFDVSFELDIDESWLHRDGVVYAGRLSVAKGSRVLEYLIKNLDCKINIIGNGTNFYSLKQFCANRKFDHVEFFGRLSNKQTLDMIKKAIVSVVPSQCGDSYPTVALESLSVGTPIIASNLGGLPDIINSSAGGILVDYSDSHAFVTGIKCLLGNKEKARELGDNGIKYIKENVSNNKQGKELVEIYRQVIKDYRLNNGCSI